MSATSLLMECLIRVVSFVEMRLARPPPVLRALLIQIVPALSPSATKGCAPRATTVKSVQTELMVRKHKCSDI